MIRLEQLNKSYRTNHVLKDVSVSMEREGIIAILGPNGSGKTTMLKCILGMVKPSSGDVLFQGVSVQNAYAYRSQISYLSQIARFPENLTASELIEFMKEIKPGETREKQFIQMFNLEGEIDKKMRSLSGGTRQKVNITLALMHDDPVIILDEPSSGLDPLSLRELKRFIKEERSRGKLILITTHILSFAEDLADDVLFLLEGRIYFDGKLKTLLANEQQQDLEGAIAHILESKQDPVHA